MKELNPNNNSKIEKLLKIFKERQGYPKPV